MNIKQIIADNAKRNKIKDGAPTSVSEIINFEYGVIQLSVKKEYKSYATRVSGDNFVYEFKDDNLLDSMALALSHVLDDGDLDVSANAAGCVEDLALFIEAIRWNTKK